MRKLILLVTLIFSTGILAQDNANVTLGINYGVKCNSIGFEVTSSKPNAISFGGGVSLSMNPPAYTGIETDDPFYWFDEVKTETGEDYSFYGLCGYHFEKVKLVGKIGAGHFETVQTYQSDVTGLYWYKITDSYFGLLLGGVVSYRVQDNWFIDLGFDNYNGTTIGVSYIF